MIWEGVFWRSKWEDEIEEISATHVVNLLKVVGSMHLKVIFF